MPTAHFTRFPALTVGPQSRVFVLTGAGISAESGIRTFRDANGLWEQHDVRWSARAPAPFAECRLGTATEAVPGLFQVVA